MISKPPFFDPIAKRAASRWDQLEADPELAGPWKQLFNQVQSPRHVLSEMLQNADDAGATCVKVSAANGTFLFEHNGRDFEENEFASLCRFGYSNKRSLHTIGFRGIGFKSLFSLGQTVSLNTPTLSVEFSAGRFTQPHWVEKFHPCVATRIMVQIEDDNRFHDLQKNFEQWKSSPLSLLFFRSIERLQIEDHEIYKEQLGPGPRPDSQWVALRGSKYDRLLHVRSAEESFPDEAINEIKKERNTEELNLPPCRVELVVGNRDWRRLFVVLPTGVSPDLPFSAHGPFLQDPARFGIKDPATSPTNRWLLARVGRLAAETMCGWLNNSQTTAESRAEAYTLLPPPGANGDTLDASATEHVSLSFREACQDQAVLLLEGGELATANQAVPMPPELLDAWPEEAVCKIFSLGGKRCLSREVRNDHKQQLQRWSWLQTLPDHKIIDSLITCREVPRPEGARQIAALWSFVHRSNYDLRDPTWRSKVRLVPTKSTDNLLPANETVRLSSRQLDIPDSEWQLLGSFVHIIDGEWLRSLQEAVNTTGASGVDNTRFAEAASLLKQLSLDVPTPVNRLMEKAFAAATHANQLSRETLIRLTHIFAAFDVLAPATFRYVNRNDQQIAATRGIILDVDGRLQEILPDDLCRQHMIHDDYYNNLVACSPAQWHAWIKSPQSRVNAAWALEDCSRHFYSHREFEDHLKTRGVNQPVDYHYRTGRVGLQDREIAAKIFAHFCKIESEFPSCWATLVQALLSGHSEQWQAEQHTEIREFSNNGFSKKARIKDIPATWIHQLSQKPCLFDTHGRPQVPVDLLLRTPDTEPYLTLEPFVASEVDTPENRPLLLQLGARDTPTGTDRLVSRIRALAACNLPLLRELFRYYDALDRAAARAQPQELAELRKEFAASRLILNNANQWSTSAEVFCLADQETIPGVAIIHDSIKDLPLWKRLGVAERPTLPAIIAWLSNLEAGHELEPHTARNVRACLKASPAQIYDQVNAWLSLDNHWRSLDQFRYKHLGGGNLRASDLFVTARSYTADLRGVAVETLGDFRFSQIPSLSDEISFVVANTTNSPTKQPLPVWLMTLGSCLARFAHGSTDIQERVRHHGERLFYSSWQEVASIKVTPYLDGTPVGQSLRPPCLWKEDTLYIKSAPLVEVIDALAYELQQPFDLPAIAEAIRICIDRPAEFIQQYLAEKFELEPVALPKPALDLVDAETSAPESLANNIHPNQKRWEQLSDRLPAQKNGTGSSTVQSIDHVTTERAVATGAIGEFSLESDEVDDAMSSTVDMQADEPPPTNQPDDHGDTPAAAVGDLGKKRLRLTENASSSASSPETSLRTPAKPAAPSMPAEHVSSHSESRPPMIERYARVHGFIYDDAQQAYHAGDGSRITRSGGLFAWEVRHPSCALPCRIWASAQSLATGLEIPAEIWEVIRSAPETTAIIHEGPGGRPQYSSGAELLQMLENETIRLFPAKYRIRRTS